MAVADSATSSRRARGLEAAIVS
uniref:Uncharacterized protein n=1 Tax=Triticum urartu TaxID=4572 RepID=A0A8R7QDC8_TRIUA